MASSTGFFVVSDMALGLLLYGSALGAGGTPHPELGGPPGNIAQSKFPAAHDTSGAEHDHDDQRDNFLRFHLHQNALLVSILV